MSLKDDLMNAKDGDVFNLAGEEITTMIDVRPTARDVVVIGGIIKDVFRIRQAQGWKLLDQRVRGGSIGMLGGSGWRLSGVDFDGTHIFSQLQIAWDDYFGTKTTPKDWTVEFCSFANQAVEGPPIGSTVHQNHNAYVHSELNEEMRGTFRNCSFSNAPNGSNLKLGGTGTFSGSAIGILVDNCRFSQEGRGANILLPGFSQRNRFTNCKIESPGVTTVHVNGPATVTFVGGSYSGRQVVSLSKKMWRSWWGAWYPVPWYSPHTEFDVAPVGKNVEGVQWTA